MSWQPVKPHVYYSAESSPGIYVIFIGKRVLYVGQSRDVASRLKKHAICNVPVYTSADGLSGYTKTPWGNVPWTSPRVTGKVSYCRPTDLLLRERRLIRKLRPIANRAHNPPVLPL